MTCKYKFRACYRISRGPLGLFFACNTCGREIDVNSFSLLGAPGMNRRTLAANAVNLHQREHKTGAQIAGLSTT
jgi:hypothetical protein